MSPAAGFQRPQRWCSAERVRVAVSGPGIPDGMSPRCRLRKAVPGVVRAQRRPGDQREKQGQRTNDRRGVFSPPSLCTTAPVHRAGSVQNQTWAAAIHRLWNCCRFSGASLCGAALTSANDLASSYWRACKPFTPLTPTHQTQRSRPLSSSRPYASEFVELLYVGEGVCEFTT
jgi:hypothetical protein